MYTGTSPVQVRWITQGHKRRADRTCDPVCDLTVCVTHGVTLRRYSGYVDPGG